MTSADISTLPPVHRVGRPSAEQSKELMAAVMRAAREEFAAKGFHHATMEAIAARAGVSKRTLYTWHADKAALLQAAILDHAVELTSYVIDPRASLKDALAAYSRAVLRELSTDYAMAVGALIMREARQFPPAGQALQQGQEYLRRPLVKLLQERGMTAAEADRIGKLYIGALLVDMQHRMIMGHAAPTPDQNRRHAAMTATLFLPGLEARLAQLSSGAGRDDGESGH
ncbi:Transcriptional regulator, TetR family [Sphingomonas paucimobilis]|nr:Transcriptional regulator, TetR family [Sphingomonas paucimobilis]